MGDIYSITEKNINDIIDHTRSYYINHGHPVLLGLLLYHAKKIYKTKKIDNLLFSDT